MGTWRCGQHCLISLNQNKHLLRQTIESFAKIDPFFAGLAPVYHGFWTEG